MPSGPGPTGPSDLLRRAAAAAPARTALFDGALRLSYADLDAEVTRAAGALRAAGAAAGDRVILHLGTGADFVRLYLGALRAGLVAVPVNPECTPSEVEFVRADSGARQVLDAAAAARLLRDTAPVDDPRGDRGGEQVAVLLYTSGTSGNPKGAMLSARALLANLDQLAAVRPALVGAEDVLFVPLPLAHVYGLNAGLGTALRVGATLVLADRVEPAAALATMAERRVTAVLGAPSHFAQWLRQPGVADGFAAVRLAMSGAAVLSQSVRDGYAALGVALHDGYGLTEAAPVLTVTAPGPAPATPGVVGRPLPGVDLQLRDVDGTVLDPADGDPGRVYVRGANLFSGYWPDGAGAPGPDGWFGTGDIGVLDPDGQLRLVGRSTDLVVVSGFNVYPAEVEAVLAAEPGVAEVAVVGRRDESTGEQVVAYVVAAAGAHLDPAALTDAAARRLARFKVPRRIEVVPVLPRTVTGKIMKWQLFGTGGDDAAG